MDLETVRQFCLSLPRVTEGIQWGNNLLFRIGGKMFCVVALDPDHGVRMSFKCSDERFAELLEREGVSPAPYLARARWVALQDYNTLPAPELRQCLGEAYELVLARLPKKQQEQLRAAASSAKNRTSAGGRGRRKKKSEGKSQRAKSKRSQRRVRDPSRG